MADVQAEYAASMAMLRAGDMKLCREIWREEIAWEMVACKTILLKWSS
jgi:hypothetical protein